MAHLTGTRQLLQPPEAKATATAQHLSDRSVLHVDFAVPTTTTTIAAAAQILVNLDWV